MADPGSTGEAPGGLAGKGIVCGNARKDNGLCEAGEGADCSAAGCAQSAAREVKVGA